MPIGDPGNESYQHLPGHPRDRIHLDAKPGGYTKRLYDPTTPATNTYATARARRFFCRPEPFPTRFVLAKSA